MSGDAEAQRSDNRWIMSAVDIENSPSRRDGIRMEEEKKKRRQTVSYIEECGKRLRLYDLSQEHCGIELPPRLSGESCPLWLPRPT